MSLLLAWVLKRPIDEFEDYDDDEEEFHPSRDEELLHGPPTLGKDQPHSWSDNTGFPLYVIK